MSTDNAAPTREELLARRAARQEAIAATVDLTDDEIELMGEQQKQKIILELKQRRELAQLQAKKRAEKVAVPLPVEPA